MAHVTLNPILEGLRGKVGDLVFKRYGNGTIISRTPTMTGEPTEAQLASQARFSEAAMFGKMIMADPDSKEFYEDVAREKGMPLFALTVADFYNAPSVNEVDLSHYTGAVGDVIDVVAFDDVDVAGVAVSISQDDGTPIEDGAATMVSPGRWQYTATAAVPTGTTVRIAVTAEDRPGGTGEVEEQKTL